MNSTDSQILMGAIELLSNRGLELRVQRLENQNLNLLWSIRTLLKIVNEIDCQADISDLIEDLEKYVDKFPIKHLNFTHEEDI